MPQCGQFLNRLLCVCALFAGVSSLAPEQLSVFAPIAKANPFLSAGGDISKGEALSASCVACHQQDGNSTNPEWPKIAGLSPSYAIKQLHAFQMGEDGGRHNPLMQGILANLSDEDLRHLVAYYASKTMSAGDAEPEPLTLGEKLYRGGDSTREIASCMACHGPRGRGIASGGIPQVGGQHAKYTLTQLRAYQKETRSTDSNRMMRNLTNRLTDEELAALANYIQGLH